MKLGLSIQELHRSENDLHAHLLRMAERHAVEHEIHHVAGDLAGWSREHLRELAAAGRRFGLNLDGDPEPSHGLLDSMREKLSEAAGRRPEPGLLLLADLRELHRTAAGVSLDWELLGQGAQAAKDSELLALTQRCHPQTLRQMRWANGMLKTLSPQVLESP
jgi:hypothetical protein